MCQYVVHLVPFLFSVLFSLFIDPILSLTESSIKILQYGCKPDEEILWCDHSNNSLNSRDFSLIFVVGSNDNLSAKKAYFQVASRYSGEGSTMTGRNISVLSPKLNKQKYNLVEVFGRK